jgi:hypothetical protein
MCLYSEMKASGASETSVISPISKQSKHAGTKLSLTFNHCERLKSVNKQCTRSFTQRVPEDISQRVKGQGRVTDHSAPSSAVAKKDGAIPPLHRIYLWLSD